MDFLDFIVGANHAEILQIINPYQGVFAADEFTSLCRKRRIKISIEQLKEIINHLDPLTSTAMNVRRAMEKIYSFNVLTPVNCD